MAGIARGGLLIVDPCIEVVVGGRVDIAGSRHWGCRWECMFETLASIARLTGMYEKTVMTNHRLSGDSECRGS